MSLIKKLKNIGFTLKEIKDLKRMGTLDMIVCDKVSPMIQEKLTKIEVQMAALQAQKKKLLFLMQACTGDCMEAFKELQE